MLTRIPLARLRHCDVWRVLTQELMDGETIRASARRAGVDRKTTFRGRHRFLVVLSTMQVERLTDSRRSRLDGDAPRTKGSGSLKGPPRNRGGRG